MNFGAPKQLEEGCSSSRRRLGTGSAAAPDVNKGGDGGKAARRREKLQGEAPHHIEDPGDEVSRGWLLSANKPCYQTRSLSHPRLP